MTDIRRTEWIACKDGPWYPGLDHGGFVAYRIWKEFDGRKWWQRHEWKCANGTVTMENWIHSLDGFGSTYTVIEKAA